MVRCGVRLGMGEMKKIHFQRLVGAQLPLKPVGDVWQNSMQHLNLRRKFLAIYCDVV